MKIAEYLSTVTRSASTVFEGMAVTFSHMFREPITIQYPDRTAKPVHKMVAPRYRGILEVQIDICQACRRCERACPIDCIRISTRKCTETKTLLIERFDIDIGKCMYCGLCSEVCVQEATGALRHTTHFEGAAANRQDLVYRYVAPGEAYAMYRPPKDKTQIPVTTSGECLQQLRQRSKQHKNRAQVLPQGRT